MLEIIGPVCFVIGFITVVVYLIRDLPGELVQRREIRNMTNPVMKNAWLRWQHCCDYGALAWLLFCLATLPLTNVIGVPAHVTMCMITFAGFFFVTLLLHRRAMIAERKYA